MMPRSGGLTGLLFAFTKVDSSGNLPTLKGSGAELINGANTYTALSSQYKSVILWCNGTKWLTIAGI